MLFRSHSFQPAEGHEGELAASPHGTRALAAITDLKRVYGMDYDLHGMQEVSGSNSPFLQSSEE